MLAVVLLLYIRFLLQKRSGDAIPLALAMGMAISIALLFAPYLWTYDQILLGLPVLAAMGYLAKQRWPYLFVAPLVLWVAALAIGLLFIALETGNDTATALVPAVCLGLVSVAARREL